MKDFVGVVDVPISSLQAAREASHFIVSSPTLYVVISPLVLVVSWSPPKATWNQLHGAFQPAPYRLY